MLHFSHQWSPSTQVRSLPVPLHLCMCFSSCSPPFLWAHLLLLFFSCLTNSCFFFPFIFISWRLITLHLLFPLSLNLQLSCHFPFTTSWCWLLTWKSLPSPSCLLPVDVWCGGIITGPSQTWQPLPPLVIGQDKDSWSSLANEILEEVYRGFCESFSFLKRKRWARKKVPPCFWLEHSATHCVVLRNSSPSLGFCFFICKTRQCLL